MMLEVTQENRRAIAHKALNLCSSLSANDRRVAAALIGHFNNYDERCDPGAVRLSLLLCIDERSVRRSLAKVTADERSQKQVNRNTVFFIKTAYGGRNNCTYYEPIWERFAEVCDQWDEDMKLRTYQLKEFLGGSNKPENHENAAGFKGDTVSPLGDKQCQKCPDTVTEMSGNSDKNARETVTELSPKPIVNKPIVKNPFSQHMHHAALDEQKSKQSATVSSSKKGPGMKRGQGGYQQSILLPINGGRHTKHGEAAIEAAIGRINDGMMRMGPAAYDAYIKLIEPDVNNRAAEAEIKQRGSGVRFILQTLETKNLEANRTRKVGAA